MPAARACYGLLSAAQALWVAAAVASRQRCEGCANEHSFMPAARACYGLLFAVAPERRGLLRQWRPGSVAKAVQMNICSCRLRALAMDCCLLWRPNSVGRCCRCLVLVLLAMVLVALLLLLLIFLFLFVLLLLLLLLLALKWLLLLSLVVVVLVCCF